MANPTCRDPPSSLLSHLPSSQLLLSPVSEKEGSCFTSNPRICPHHYFPKDVSLYFPACLNSPLTICKQEALPFQPPIPSLLHHGPRWPH